jgi:hypothetical protein
MFLILNGILIYHFSLQDFMVNLKIGRWLFAYLKKSVISNKFNHIGDILVSVLAMSAADSGFELRRNPTKDYIICICSFSAKHTVLRRKSWYKV